MSLHDDTRIRLQSRIVRRIREATGLHEQFVLPIATDIMDGLLAEFRGETIYISQDRAERDRRVMADFTGNNVDEVCQKHGISESTFYRILRKRRRCGAKEFNHASRS